MTKYWREYYVSCPPNKLSGGHIPCPPDFSAKYFILRSIIILTVTSKSKITHLVCRSAWIVRLRGRLSVCPQHNSKTNDPKVFKLGIGFTSTFIRPWNILEVIWFWG